MEIFILKNGKSLGPFGEQEVIDKVDRGELSEQDLAMTDGLANWTPLGSIIVREPAYGPFTTVVHNIAEISEDAASKIVAGFVHHPCLAGAFALVAGCILIFLSQWPVLIYSPFLILSLVAACILLARRRLFSGIVVFALTLILPTVIWEKVYDTRAVYSLGSMLPIPPSISTPVASSPPPSAAPLPSSAPEPIPGLPPSSAAASPPSVTPEPSDDVIAQSIPLPATTDTTPSPAPTQNAVTPPPFAPTQPAPQPSATASPITQAQAPSSPTPSPAPQLDILSQVYLVTTDQGKGSGFFVVMSDGTFFVTNFHVVEGAKTIDCSNPTRHFTLAGGQIQIATDRDLVRIRAARSAGLPLNESPTIGQSAAAYGDSGGKDIVTKLDGKILGVGPRELEVSSEFIPGNSGGPIITSSGDVVAVATYVARETGIPDWVKSGTRFKGTRRFGVRVSNDIKWTPMPLATFEDQSARISKTDDLIDELIATSRELIYDPFQRAIQTNFPDIEAISNFVNNYNATCNEYRETAGSKVTKSELRQINIKFDGRIRQNASDLAAAIDSIQTDLTFRSQDITAPYLHERMAESIGALHDLSQFINQSAQDTSSQSLFRLKK